MLSKEQLRQREANTDPYDGSDGFFLFPQRARAACGKCTFFVLKRVKFWLKLLMLRVGGPLPQVLGRRRRCRRPVGI